MPSELRFRQFRRLRRFRYGHFLALTLMRTLLPKTVIHGSKRAQTGSRECAGGCGGPLTACHARPIGPEASRAPTDVPRAQSGAVWGLFLARLAPFWPLFLRVPTSVGAAAARSGGEGQHGAENWDSGKAPLGQANPRVSRRGWRQIWRRETFAAVTCLRVASLLLLLWGEGSSYYYYYSPLHLFYSP